MKSMKTRKYLFLGFLVAMVGIIGFSVLNTTKSQKQVLTEEQKRLLNYNQVEAGEEAIDGTDKVTFDAFFLKDLDNDGNAEGLRGISKEIGKKEKLWLELKVLGDVTLKDAEIKFVNTNVNISGKFVKDDIFLRTINSTNLTSIPLNNVTNGTTSTFSVDINTNLTNDITSYSGINKVILTGKVVGDDGSVTEITKEVSYQADWYGNVNAKIGSFETEVYAKAPSEKANQTIVYNIKTYSTNSLLLKSAHIKGTVGELNGYKAVNVKVEGANIEYTWDEDTQTFEAKREAKLDENIITSQAYSYKDKSDLYNEWKVVVEYEPDAGTLKTTATLSLETWYEGFNNQNPGYENVVESNHATKVLSTDFNPQYEKGNNHLSTNVWAILTINNVNKTGLYSYYNTRIVNETTNYKVNWEVVLTEYNPNISATKLIMDDNNGDKINNISAKPYVKYKTISFGGNPTYYLGTSGYIKLINADTDEVIHVFTSLDWDTLYTFDRDVRSIRIETSGILDSQIQKTSNYQNNINNLSKIDLSLFNITFTKEISNEAIVNNLTYEQFDILSYIQSTVNVDEYINRNEAVLGATMDLVTETGKVIYTIDLSSLKPGECDGLPNGMWCAHGTTDADNKREYLKKWDPYTKSGKYVVGTSQANIRLITIGSWIKEDTRIFGTTEEINTIIEITTNEQSNMAEGWKNGEFLVVLPKEILDVKVNSIVIKESDAKIVGTEIVTLEDGRKAIKVLVESDYIYTLNDLNAINIAVTLTPDARISDKYVDIELLAYNPNCDNYDISRLDSYDLNGNGSTTDKISYNKTSLSLIAPARVITTTTLTNYHDENVTISPLVAEVNPILDDKQATVTVGITNNSGNSIENVKVIGKVAYIGNTYQIGDGELGSEFNVKMQSPITVPEIISAKTKVYYSEVETPTDDLTDTANGWTEEPTSFDDIKTYMIVIEDYTITNKQQLNFSYDVEMDNVTSNMFKKTYFTHGVYYDLVTDEGNYSTSVGGSKLGITMVRKYKLNLNVFKTASDTKVEKSRFLITDEDGNEYIITTDKNGNAILDGLYVDKEYTIKNISTPYDYAIDEEVKTFKVVNNDDDSLELEYAGNFKKIEYTDNNILNMDLENETRYTVILKNTDFDTNEKVSSSSFILTGKGYENGYGIMTDDNGEFKLKGLYLNEVYEIEQLNAPKYLKTEKFRIRLIRDEDNELKITVEKYPVVSDLLKHPSYTSTSNSFEYYSNSINSYWNPSYVSSYYTQSTYGIVNIDLSELKEDYKLVVRFNHSYPTSSSFRTMLYVGENVTSTSYNSNAGFVSNSSTNGFNVGEITKSYDVANNKIETFKAGEKYTASLYYYRAANKSGNLSIYSIDVIPVSGKIEMLPTGTNENVVIPDNDRVVQTLNDSEGLAQPELTVNIKNKAIPTYTFELHKTDAETGEALAGAQYKITGPGLPENGKYLTTDENGYASVELYENITGNYSQAGLYTKEERNQFETEYEIEEVVAPVGYTLDNSKIKFESYKSISCTTKYVNGNNVCEDGTVTSKAAIHYFDENNKFDSDTYDDEAGKALIEVSDYPLIKIVKKDAETGEVLPNTLFAIYELKYVGGNEVLTPAKDANGNVVGQEVEINGRTYQAIVTNEKGELSLNLGKGKYKIQEIQAADEKYELDSGVYYFGVGETIPYQPASMDLLYAIEEENLDISTSNSSDNYLATKDGGWITINTEYTYNNGANYDSVITKYDADGNVEWINDEPFRFTNDYTYHYFDNPDRTIKKEINYYDKNNGYGNIIEAADGGYYVSAHYTGSVFRKLDSEGNILWQNQYDMTVYDYEYQNVCRFDENDNLKDPVYDEDGNIVSGKVKLYYEDYSTGEFKASQNYNPSTGEYTTAYSDLTENLKRDNDTYYCDAWPANFVKIPTNSRSYYYGFYSSPAYKVALPDGGIAMISQSASAYFPLADGTNVEVQEGKSYLLIYNNEGKITDVYDVYQLFEDGNASYKAKYGLSDSSKPYYNYFYWYTHFDSYSNGDLLISSSYSDYDGSSVIKLHKNEATGKYEISWFVPYGASGIKFKRMGTVYDQSLQIQLIEDENGNQGFVVGNSDTFYSNSYYSSRNSYYDTPPLQYEMPLEYDAYNNRYDYIDGILWVSTYMEQDEEDGSKQAYLTDMTPILDSSRNLYTTLLYGNTDFYRIFILYREYLSYYQFPNGSIIVAAQQSTPGEGNWDRILYLANGEKFEYDDDKNFVVYEVNKDGKIEWIKQYRNAEQFGKGAHIRLSADGTKLLVPVTVKANSTLEEVGNDSIPLIQNTTSSDRRMLLVYELKDEITPEGPEAYTLNINNKRKEYKVNIETDLGGNILVTNPSGNKVYEGNGPTTVEKVKYGDDSKNTIKITPDENYIITGVTVNGEEHSFKVNDDGSIIVDTIKDIKENKDIKITVVNGLSSVIVHHYKENTQERVASDEVLTGMVLTPYETEPITSKLYSLVLDENGDTVIPNNYKGTFNTEKQVVTYYYKENEVDLEIHYYVNDTEIELAPSKVETYVLGAQYRTSALNIEFYELAKVIGEEEGTLEDAKTTVTYFYNELTESTITTRYIDKATGKDIVEPIVQIVDRHADYETVESDKIPANYRFVSKTSNATGKAETQNIEVIYYYEEIEFNVSVDKKINTILINGEKIEISDAKLAKIEPKKEDSVIVYYDIILKNSGELRATFKVSEQDVENFEIYDLGDFVKEDGSYVLTVELEPGEAKTYKIGYKWNQKDYGISKNKVELKEVGNALGIKEKDKDRLDNISETEIVLGVPTGMNIKLTIIIITSIIISGGIVTIALTKGRIKK